MANKVVYI